MEKITQFFLEGGSPTWSQCLMLIHWNEMHALFPKKQKLSPPPPATRTLWEMLTLIMFSEWWFVYVSEVFGGLFTLSTIFIGLWTLSQVFGGIFADTFFVLEYDFFTGNFLNVLGHSGIFQIVVFEILPKGNCRYLNI